MHGLNVSSSIPSTWPASINQPSSSPMFLHLLSQHGCILGRMHHYKCSTKAGWKCSLWLLNTVLCPCHLFSIAIIINIEISLVKPGCSLTQKSLSSNQVVNQPIQTVGEQNIYNSLLHVYWWDSRFSNYQSSITTDKVIHGLGQAQLAHRWEHAECITCQKDDIFWMRTNTWYLSIRNELYRICCPCIFCNSKSQINMYLGEVIGGAWVLGR